MTTITSTKVEVMTVTATLGSLVETAAVTFVAGPPASSTTTLAANPNALAANGTGTTVLTEAKTVTTTASTPNNDGPVQLY